MTKTIGTHNGTFHCDEALACYLLRKTASFSGAEIVRSRDPETLDKCDIQVDVGAVFDATNNRFDHHQRGFEEVFSPRHQTKLSSAGLIYKYFGKEIITNLTGCNEDDLELLYQKQYNDFIEALDGIDNGISQYEKGVQPRYKSNTDLSSRVGRLNPAWNETDVDINARFNEAVALTGKEFEESLMSTYKSWLPARQIVVEAIETRFSVHTSGRILKLPTFTVWKSHLEKLEKEMDVQELLTYVLYEDSSHNWRVQAVAVAEGSFESRVPLLEEWRGIRNDELSKLAGIEGCIFVHASGFIGGNKTYEGALQMAIKSLNLSA